MTKLHLLMLRSLKVSFSTTILASVVTSAVADTQYGPIRAGETLSSIVNENYLVSPFEDRVIMQEIFRTNPEAFINNNMGLMKQGVTLTLPDDATIRRSRGSATTSRQSTLRVNTPDTAAITRSLELTLTQVRNERDQANLKVRRLEKASLEQTESFNKKLSELESDNLKISNDLEVANQELSDLKASFEDISAENKKLNAIASAADSDTSNEVLNKQLENSNAELETKKQEVGKLEALVTQLESKAQSIENQHKDTVAKLESDYKALEDKLAQQVSLIESSARAEDSDAEVTALQAKHEAVLADLRESYQSNLSKEQSLQASLSDEVSALKSDIQSKELELKSLSDKNTELSNTLSDLQDNAHKLTADNAAPKSTITKLEAEAVTAKTSTAPLLSGPITKEVLVEQLENPVSFPLWGLLLGAFALGFTTLMMLFTRSRRVIVNEVSENSAISTGTSGAPLDASREDLVFKAAKEGDLIDPDVETLRAPQRRDPNRVAILDPSMESNVPLVDSVSTVDTEESSLAVKSVEPSEADSLEAGLKILMAEAYHELGDLPAANELLDEAHNEGSASQQATIAKLKVVSS